jgi:hypothetical protein
VADAPLVTRLRARALPVVREVLFHLWSLSSRMPLSVSGPSTGDQLVVVIPAYHESRVRNLAPLVRTCLRCRFVSRVIVSSHNPDVRMRRWVPRDARVQVREYDRRFGCGHVWKVASQEDALYFLIIDDDQLLTRSQISVLFRHLRAQPDVPHGLTGALRGIYHERRDMSVDALYNLYAVTRAHLHRYEALARELETTYAIPPADIEYVADDVLISHAGTGQPCIHDAGFILRCGTGNTPGVATFKEQDFDARRRRVEAAVLAIAGQAG